MFDYFFSFVIRKMKKKKTNSVHKNVIKFEILLDFLKANKVYVRQLQKIAPFYH